MSSTGSRPARLDRTVTDYPEQVAEALRRLYARWLAARADSASPDHATAEALHYYQFLVRAIFVDPAFGMGSAGADKGAGGAREGAGGARGLLVYHGTGMGKTRLAAATGIALMGAPGMPGGRQPVVLLPFSLRANFVRGIGEAVAALGGAAALGYKSAAEVVARFRFVSLDAFNAAAQLGRVPGRAGKVGKAASRATDADAVGSLDGCTLIVDEAHNLFRGVINSGAPTTNARRIYDAVMAARDIRIVFLSGTPVSKDPFELVPCFNMLAGHELLPASYEIFSDMFIDRAAGRLRNENLLANRLTGLVSHAALGAPDTPPGAPGAAGAAGGMRRPRDAGWYPELLQPEVVRVPMGPAQYTTYLLARAREIAEGKGSGTGAAMAAARGPPPLALPGSERQGGSTYYVKSRTLSLFAPSDEYRTDFIRGGAKALPDAAFTAESAPKLAIASSLIGDAPGFALAYSQFVASGLEPLGRLLTAAGFVKYEPSSSTRNAFAAAARSPSSGLAKRGGGGGALSRRKSTVGAGAGAAAAAAAAAAAGKNPPNKSVAVPVSIAAWIKAGRPAGGAEPFGYRASITAALAAPADGAAERLAAWVAALAELLPAAAFAHGSAQSGAAFTVVVVANNTADAGADRRAAAAIAPALRPTVAVRVVDSHDAAGLAAARGLAAVVLAGDAGAAVVRALAPRFGSARRVELGAATPADIKNARVVLPVRAAPAMPTCVYVIVRAAAGTSAAQADTGELAEVKAARASYESLRAFAGEADPDAAEVDFGPAGACGNGSAACGDCAGAAAAWLAFCRAAGRPPADAPRLMAAAVTAIRLATPATKPATQPAHDSGFVPPRLRALAADPAWASSIGELADIGAGALASAAVCRPPAPGKLNSRGLESDTIAEITGGKPKPKPKPARSQRGGDGQPGAQPSSDEPAAGAQPGGDEPAAGAVHMASLGFPSARDALPPFRTLFERLRSAAVSPPAEWAETRPARGAAWPARGEFAGAWLLGVVVADDDAADAGQVASLFTDDTPGADMLAAWQAVSKKQPGLVSGPGGDWATADARAARTAIVAELGRPADAAAGALTVAYAFALARSRAAATDALRVYDAGSAGVVSRFAAARAAGASEFVAPGLRSAGDMAAAVESLAGAADRVGAPACRLTFESADTGAARTGGYSVSIADWSAGGGSADEFAAGLAEAAARVGPGGLLFAAAPGRGRGRRPKLAGDDAGQFSDAGAFAAAASGGAIMTVFAWRRAAGDVTGGARQLPRVPEFPAWAARDDPGLTFGDTRVDPASHAPDTPLVDPPRVRPPVPPADAPGTALSGPAADRVDADENDPALDDDLAALDTIGFNGGDDDGGEEDEGDLAAALTSPAALAGPAVAPADDPTDGLADAFADDPTDDPTDAPADAPADALADALADMPPTELGQANIADDSGSIAAAIELAVAEAAAVPARRFAILSGETSPEERAAILAIQRSPQNARGELLSALLISKTGAEGLDLKCGRLVIHLEPYWSASRHAQVDARVVRVGSHDALPPADRDVRSVTLVAIANDTIRDRIPPEFRELATTDEVFLAHATEKGALVNAALALLRSVSVECSVLGYAEAGVCASCHTCVPTGARLFRGDAPSDARLADPCRPRGAAAAVAATPVAVDGELFHWRPDPAAPTGVAVFVFRADVGAHVALAPNDRRMPAILAAIDKHN
jgi:hypothetical protein